MIEPRIVDSQARVATLEQQSVRTSTIGLLQASAVAMGTAVARVGVWAGDTAQQFGVLLAVLMAPAVFSTYAFVVWSLAANLGWTDSFVFTTGPLSNWLVWLGVAVLVHSAATILKKHTRIEG